MSFEEWKETTAENFCFKVTDGTHDSPKKVLDGKYLITSRHLKGFELDLQNAYLISNEDFTKINERSKVDQWDILFSMIGTVGEVYLERNSEINYTIKNVGLFKFNGDKLRAKWFYYFLKSKHSQEYIYANLRGSTQQYLTLGALRKFPVFYPKNEIEMKKIINILDSLDQKIQLNNQINKNLEEMAQAIFKSWFVDFEPFQDGEFVESELGLIPKGWEVGNFNKLVSELIGGDWGKEEPQKNHQQKVYCIRGADIPEVARGNKGKIPVRYILEKNALKKSLKSGDIVIEISGGSPTQSTGRAVLINDELLERFDSSLICTNFCRVIKLKEDYYSTFVYLYLKYLYEKEVFFQFENGTTGIKNLDITSFLEVYQIVIPSKEILNTFNNLVDKCFSSIQQLGKENEILSNLRDTLLPKLMSGEIRVPL
jgi:type I restriction enzyme, S subunit